MSITSPTTSTATVSTTNPPATSTTTTATGATTRATGTAGSTVAPAGGGLGENSFLTLMMDQLKNQDPLSPSDPTQYLSELSSFSTLQQETNIAGSSSTAAAGTSATAALALLGHTVNYTDANGTTQTGTVQKVNFSSSGPSLTVGGATGIAPASVTEVS